jgi:Lrp/AsnC family transcriptional regulator
MIHKIHKIDKIDKEILKIIQKNATIPLSELSKKVGISSTPCWNRIKKMEEEKIIISRVTVIDNKKINLPNIAFLYVQAPVHSDEWLEKFIFIIKKYDQIIETHRISGSHDYLLKILFSSSIEDYDVFQQKFIRETGCKNMQTSFSQQEIKNSKSMPLDMV